MATCHRCGQTIRWAEVSTEDGGITRVERIKLAHLPSMRGENRFREIGYNPLRVEPVGPSDDVIAYAKHDCGGIYG
jgi:hypothetical protein